jgi:hypothetical protein
MAGHMEHLCCEVLRGFLGRTKGSGDHGKLMMNLPAVVRLISLRMMQDASLIPGQTQGGFQQWESPGCWDLSHKSYG